MIDQPLAFLIITQVTYYLQCFRLQVSYPFQRNNHPIRGNLYNDMFSHWPQIVSHSSIHKVQWPQEEIPRVERM